MLGSKPYTVEQFFAAFDEKVDRSGGSGACWPWIGAIYKSGHGEVRQNGKNTGTHRVALERHLGRPLGKGLCSLHHCDNPPCCNPAHLFEGTQLDNIRDRDQKGRGRRVIGEANPRSIVTESDVREIRRRAKTETQRSLAEEYGVAPHTISMIVTRRNWAHVV